MSKLAQRNQHLTTKYALIQCIFNMAYCCIINFAAVFLLGRGFSNAEVGVTLTLANALALITQPLIATFADQSQRVTLRQLVAGLLVLCGLAALLLMVTPALLLPTALLYILLICAFNSQGSLVVALALEHINAGMPINFSLARGIGSFAFAILALVLGNLTNRYGSAIIMPVGLVISLLGAMLVASFPKAASPTTAANTVAPEQAVGFGEFARRNGRFIALLGSITLLYFSHALINTYTIQIVTHVGGSTADMGMVSAIGGFLELPAMALFPLLMQRVKHAGTILKWSGLFFILKGLLTLLAPNVGWLYAAQCCQFFAYALFTPASVYYVNQVIRGADKVKGQAGMTMALGVSSMIGNFLGGFMLDTSGGVGFMLTVGLAVSLVGLVLVLLLTERAKGTPAVALQSP